MGRSDRSYLPVEQKTFLSGRFQDSRAVPFTFFFGISQVFAFKKIGNGPDSKSNEAHYQKIAFVVKPGPLLLL